jgi:ubiquinol-cytochrome c reductase iron-sulfur subunit
MGTGRVNGGTGVQLAVLQMDWVCFAMTKMDANEIATDFLVNMSASADVLAQAKVEIDLSAIPEGKNVRLPRRRVPPQFRQLTAAGHYQVARQARLHPTPHRG